MYETISHEIASRFSKHKPSAADYAIKSEICDSLQSSIDRYFKSQSSEVNNVNFKLFMFGSSETGLGDANADLDLGEYNLFERSWLTQYVDIYGTLNFEIILTDSLS